MSLHVPPGSAASRRWSVLVRWRPRRSSATGCATCTTDAGRTVDGTPLAEMGKVDASTGRAAVAAAVQAHQDWSKQTYAHRHARVSEAVELLAAGA